MSLDDKLYGWDAGLLALVRMLERWKLKLGDALPADTVKGWDDAISTARRLIGDARTQKGFVARECAKLEAEEPRRE